MGEGKGRLGGEAAPQTPAKALRGTRGAGQRHQIFIDGEAGTTGLDLRERLRRLPVTLLRIEPDRRKDPEARAEMMRAADLTVLCLPDGAARDAVAAAPPEARLLDASSAHRTAPGWVYGLPELAPDQATRIATAGRVSNPGCYATGAIALLRPLVARGLLPPDHPVTLNAVSGYSGGGRAMIESHELEDGPAFELYALGLDHKHIAEITRHAGLTRRPLFVPSVGHFRQGMLVSLPLHLDTLPSEPAARDIEAVFAEWYRGAATVRVMPADTDRLTPEALNGTGDMELRVFADAAGRQALLVARLDNLGKGASSAALHNIALMLGLDAANA